MSVGVLLYGGLIVAKHMAFFAAPRRGHATIAADFIDAPDNNDAGTSMIACLLGRSKR